MTLVRSPKNNRCEFPLYERDKIETPAVILYAGEECNVKMHLIAEGCSVLLIMLLASGKVTMRREDFRLLFELIDNTKLSCSWDYEREKYVQ